MKFCRKMLYVCAAVLILVIGAVSYECYVRVTTSYAPPLEWRIEPAVGVTYKPSPNTPEVNDFGFLDKRRLVEKPVGLVRILALGDSFISGRELTSDLEAKLTEDADGNKFEVIPMGFPGTGSAGQMAFFEVFGKQLKPDVVFMVFNSSTFGNNSALLQSVVLGFNPEHPWTPFLQEDPNTGSVREIGVSPESDNHRLRSLPPIYSRSMFRRLEERLDSWFQGSYLYGWLRESMMWSDTRLQWRGRDAETAYRIAQLRQNPEYAAALAGWNFPDDLEVHDMFWTETETMPEAFKAALENTSVVMRRMKRECAEMGARFLVVISPDCRYMADWRISRMKDRTVGEMRHFLPDGYYAKIEGVLRREGVEFLDLYPLFKKNGIEKGFAPNDPHLNAEGERWAAAAIARRILTMGN